jgi:hypothetical protein
MDRVKNVTNVYEISENLQKKLDQRDAEIAKLRRQIRAYEAIERM